MYSSSTCRASWLSVKLIFSLAVLAAGLDSPIRAQDAIATKVDDYLKAEMQRQHIPGLSLAVVKDGQIILAKGFGFANVEHQVPVKPETIFQSGSMGKQFTATAVMMLVEAGKLSLSDPITKYFSEAPDSWKNITVRHRHTQVAGRTTFTRDFDSRRNSSH